MIFFFPIFQAYSPLGRPGSPAFTGPSFLSNPIVISAAEKLKKTPAQVALRWGVQMGQSVVPKSTNETRIKENFDIFDWSIPEDLMDQFSQIPQPCLNTSFTPRKFSYIMMVMLFSKKKMVMLNC